jgi:hypothetical protein
MEHETWTKVNRGSSLIMVCGLYSSSRWNVFQNVFQSVLSDVGLKKKTTQKKVYANQGCIKILLVPGAWVIWILRGEARNIAASRESYIHSRDLLSTSADQLDYREIWMSSHLGSVVCINRSSCSTSKVASWLKQR